MLPSIYCQQSKHDHKTVIKLMSHSNELVLRLEQQHYENVHFGTSWFVFHSFFVNSNNKPHPEDVKDNMNITHIVFVDIKAGDPVKEAINV